MANESAREEDNVDDIEIIGDLNTGLMAKPSNVVMIPLWEAKWGKEALQRHWRKMSQRAIARGFRQEPIADDQLFIKPELVEACKDPNLSIVNTLEKKSFALRLRRFGGNDIASGEGANSAWWVVVVIGIDPKTKHRYILHMRRKQGLSVGKQFAQMAEVYDALQWETCGVESNGIQAAIEKFFREEGTIPTKPIHTGSLQKNDEEVGIPAMFSEFEHKLWHIPDADAYSRRIMEPLVNELKVYPTGKYSDCVMACYFASQMYLQSPKGGPQCGSLSF